MNTITADKQTKYVLNLDDTEGGQPERKLRVEIDAQSTGVWALAYDAQGKPLCSIKLDFFMNQIKALVYDWQAESKGDDPAHSLVLVPDVDAALALSSEERYLRAMNWRDLTDPTATIRAECHSDDKVVEVTFSATPWFEQAADEQIRALAECGWQYDYPADAVAHFMAEKSDDVAYMFRYLELRNANTPKNLMGFGCSVEEKDALRWLAAHRPDLHAELTREEVAADGD